MAFKLEKWSLGLISFAFAVATFVRAPLNWDGITKLFLIVQHNTVVLFEERYSILLLEAPTLIFRRITTKPELLSFIFCLSYCAAYPATLYYCLKTSREKMPRLTMWPFLCFGLTGIWFQSYFTSEMTLVSLLVWPVFFQRLLSPNKVPYAASLVLFFLHPNSFLFFIFFGWMRPINPDCTGRGNSRSDSRNTQTFRYWIEENLKIRNFYQVFFWWLLALLRVLLMTDKPTDYEFTNVFYWHNVNHPSLTLSDCGEFLAILYGLLFLFEKKISSLSTGIFRVLLSTAIVLFLLRWSLDSSHFISKQDFFVNPSTFTLIFMFFCWFDSRIPTSHRREPREFWGIFFPSLICSLGTIALAFHWNTEVQNFQKALSENDTSCIEWSSVPNRQGRSPIREEFAPLLSIILQNTLQPRKVIVPDGECKNPDFQKSLSLLSWHERYSRQTVDAFDFSRTGL